MALWRWRRRARTHDDGGFSLIEIGVATGILFSVVLMIAYSGVVALIDVGHSRQRQGATGLANEALEQVRALPFDTVALGLATSDIAAMTDPNIARAGTAGAYTYSYRGESIAHGNHGAVEPLAPHLHSRTVEETRYTVAVYVTRYKNNVSNNTLRVTAEVTWADPLRKGISPTVEAQTVLFPGSGCQSTDTHPYAAPCTGFFEATAISQPGVIAVDGWVLEPDGSGSRRADVSAELVLPGQQSTLKQEQIATVSNTAEATGLAVALGSAEHRHQPETVTSSADTDPSSSWDDGERLLAGPLAPRTFGTSTQNVLRASTLGLDELDVSSSAAASGAPGCADASGNPQTDRLLCGTSSADQGAGGSISLAINYPAPAGAVVIASVGRAGPTTPTVTQRGSVDRQAAGGSTCPGTGDGCATSTVIRTLGELAIGPTGAPVVRITDAVDAATAMSGSGASAPTTSRTGSLEYWNGATHTSLGLTDPRTFETPVFEYVAANVRALVRGDFEVAAPHSESDACTSPCLRATSLASSPSLLTGSGTFDVWVDGVQVAALRFNVNLGGLTAQAIYRAAVASG